MRLRRTFSWIAIGTLVMLVLLVAWLWFADLGFLKPQIERWVSDSTGREFSIDGELDIHLGQHASVVAEGVRLQNVEWAQQPDMVKVGRIEARVDLWSLVSGPIIIDLIDVDDAAVYLSQVEDKDPNWTFPSTGGPDHGDDEESGPLDLIVRRIDVDAASLVYETWQRDRPLDLAVATLRQTHRDDGYLDIELDAKLNDRVVSLDGEAGTWDALLAAKDIHFDVTAVLDTLHVTAAGSIDDVARPRRPQIEFSAKAPDIDDVTRLLGIGEEGEGDIDLHGKLAPGDDQMMHLTASGNVGKTEIAANGSVRDLQDYSEAEIKITASAPDLGRILRIAGIHNVREAPFSIDVDAERHGSSFEVHKAEGSFADTKFSASASLPKFPAADEGKVELRVQGPAIERLLYVTGMPAVAEGPFDVTAAISKGGSGKPELKLEARTPLGGARVQGNVGPAPRFVGSELDIEADAGSLARLSAAYGLDVQLPDSPARVAGRVAVEDGAVRTVKPVTLRLGNDGAKIDGSLALASGASGSRFNVEASGPTLAGLVGGFADASYVPAKPYSVQGSASIAGWKLRLADVSGTLGSARLSGEGVLAFSPDIAGSRFSAKIDGPAFEDFEDSFAGLKVRKGKFGLSGAIEFSKDAISLEKIDLERPGASAKLDLQIGRSSQHPWLKFDANASGRDVTAAFHGRGGFELLPLPFSLSVEGDHHGDRWSFLNAKAAVGDATASADGVIDLRGATANSAFKLQVAVPSLAQFAKLADRGFRDQALSLDAEVRGGGGVLTAKQFNLKVGESDVHGDLEVRAGDVPEIDVVVSSNSIIVAPILEDPETPEEPIALQGDGRMIPDIPLPFDALAKFNSTLDIAVQRFQYDKVVLTNVALDATVKDGVLDVPNLAFDALTGSARGQLRLDPDGGKGSGFLRLAARDLYMGLQGMDAKEQPHGDWDVNLEFTGADLRSVLASTDGIVFIRRFGGQLAKGNRFVQALYGDLLEEILDTINPFRESEPFTPIECIVIASEVSDGKISSAPSSLVLTDKLMIVARASVDLGSEKIDLAFRTEPKRRLSISAAELINPYFQVIGTLAAPRLAVDQKGVLITGGAAVATGGLTILAQGLWSRLTRSNDPCSAAVADGMQTLGDRLPKLETGKNDAS